MIAYALLLVAFLDVQRSSSETIPFDNPFWVKWLQGQRRSGRPTTISEVGSNQGPLQQKLTLQTFGNDFSTETVPPLQPLFSREKANIFERGKVVSPTIKTQLDSGYINEHDSDGQLSKQRLNRKVSQINGKSALPSNSFKSNTFEFNAADAKSQTSINRLPEDKDVNEEKEYIEENRSSSNLLPIHILDSNEFIWPNTLHPPSSVPSSLISNDNNFDDKLFDIRGDEILNKDELSYNLITSTLTPAIRPVEEKYLGNDLFFKNKQLDSQDTTSMMLSGADINKSIDDTMRDSSVFIVEETSMAPMETAAYTFSSTTSTPSTTTRTLVASWPAVRSRNLGASRAETRFRKRVPISSSRKSFRRGKVSSKRRQNLKRKNHSQGQNLKRRRQTIIPQFKSVTSPRPVITTSSIFTSTISKGRETIKTTVSRTPRSSTSTLSTTTTTLRRSTTETTTTTSETSTATTPEPTVAPTTAAATFVFTNLRTASALVVTRNVTSTRVVTAPIPGVEERKEEATFATTTEMTSTDRDVVSSTHFISEEDVEQEGEAERFLIETKIKSTPNESKKEYVSLHEQYIPDDVAIEYEPQESVEIFIPMPSNIKLNKVEDPGVRSPRLTDWEEPPHTPEKEVPLILSGQYHEMNPGQYHEVDPGQYHEPNPGQYHETNPGQPVLLGNNQEVQAGQYHEEHPGQPVALAQKDGDVLHAGEYHEVNPGQYHEVNPGQYHEVNPGQYIDDTSKESDNSENKAELVGVKQTDNAKIYNVQQRVNEFIIGEYGTISNSGQTLQGVRYTAVADDHSGVDPHFIYETLVKYFPMAAEKFAENNPTAAS